MNKLLVIGLDGMSPELLDLLINEGVFSTIGYIRDNGVYGDMESTIPPVTGPAWASFATGVNPGKHGIFDFALPLNSLLNIKALSSQDIAVKTFYEFLDDQGRKSVIINMPLSWPPLTQNPTLTSLLTQSGELVFPSNLKIDFPVLKKYRIVPDKNHKDKKYISDIRKLEKTKFECAMALLKLEWDFFFLLFSGTDWLSHYAYDKLVSGEKDKALFDFFKDIDNYVRVIIEKINQGVNIFVISDHGFRKTSKQFYINEWLAKEGYLSKSSKNIVKKERHAFMKQLKKTDKRPIFKFSQMSWILKIPILSKILTKIYLKISNLLPFRVKISQRIDPIRTRAFSATTESFGIYINRKDFFMDGSVSPTEYEELRDEIVKKLLNITDHKTGKKIFRNIWKKEEKFKGPHLEKAPDIILDLGADYSINTRLGSPYLLEKKKKNDHDMIGIFIAYGPDIKKQYKVKRLKIIDLASTILFMLQSKIPHNLDGQVLKDIFNESSNLNKLPIEYMKIGRFIRTDQVNDNEDVIERLKALGYIE